MTVRGLLAMEDIDIDVGDDYDERCYIAYVSGYKLTDAGKERFKDALDLEVTLHTNCLHQYAGATLHCDTAKQASACRDLFNALAGYCGESDFNKWFKWNEEV